MSSQDTIRQFLTTQTDISLGYASINFFDPSKLQEEQAGYSHDGKGKSLVTGKAGDWKSDWIVIASDESGDPLLVDQSIQELPVFSAIHGVGHWEPFIIADSLANFGEILQQLREISVGREYPVLSEVNPIPEKRVKEFLSYIQENNPSTDISFWISMVRLDED